MKRTVLTLVIAAFASYAAAAGPKPTNKTPKAKPQTESSVSAFKISTGTPHNITELITHFDEIDKNLQSLSANFEQTLAMPDAGLTQQVEGKIEYVKPDHFRMEHRKPERQTIVADGEKIWIYRAGQNQVIESSLAEWKKSDPLINNLMDFGNYSKLLAGYDIAYDSSTLKITLKPKEKTAQPFTLRLKLSGPHLFPLATEMEVEQTKIRSQLSQVRFNPAIPESRFKFTPPKDAQVLDNFRLPNRNPTSP